MIYLFKQPTVHGIHGVNGELAQSHVEEEDKKESEALTLPQLSEVDNVKVQQANLEFVTTIHVQVSRTLISKSPRQTFNI